MQDGLRASLASGAAPLTLLLGDTRRIPIGAHGVDFERLDRHAAGDPLWDFERPTR